MLSRETQEDLGYSLQCTVLCFLGTTALYSTKLKPENDRRETPFRVLHM